ncbi:MAG: hypothetical protein ABEL76_05170 [Bradymonadaceae bacterium]
MQEECVRAERYRAGASVVRLLVGIDHYPGTWSNFGDYAAWKPLEILLRRINDPDDPWYGKSAAIMETGFSTWHETEATQADQVEWIRTSLSEVWRQAVHNNPCRKHDLVALNYYQLIDDENPPTEPEGRKIPQERHFGVWNADLEPKAGWGPLKTKIAEFRGAACAKP